MKSEKSCGAVIYRKNGQNIEFLAVRSRGFSGFWGFPKGHVEEGETEEETCIREIMEETGLRVQLVKNFREVDYYILGSGIKKEVVYFLALAENSQVTKQEEEIADFGWGDFQDVYYLLTYNSAKEVLKKANCFLQRK